MNSLNNHASDPLSPPTRRAEDESVRELIRGVRGAPFPISEDPFIHLNKTIMVRAGAGSGKTTVLIERMLALVRSGVPLSEIVAITFTKKAAGEIQKRFFEALIELQQDFSKKCVDSTHSTWHDELKHVETALQHAESIFIGTIHAFCAQLLRIRSLDLNVPIDFSQIDEREELVLRQKFWSKYLHEKNETGDPDLFILQNAQVSLASLVEFFGTMSKNASLTFVQSDSEKPDLSGIYEKLGRYRPAIERRIPPMEPDHFTTTFEQIHSLSEIADHPNDFDKAVILKLVVGLLKGKDAAQLLVAVSSWGANKTEPRLFANALRDGKEDIGMEKPFLAFITEEIAPVVSQWDAWVHNSAIRVVSDAIENYRKERLRSGKLTFDDLLFQAHVLVSEHPEAREHLQNQFRFILVDEFQDTDPVQAAMLFGLASKQIHPEDWSRSTLIPGRLFLVGDDKQSIYRFRKADFQAFHLVGSAIEQQGGSVVNLSVNFRSDARICDWINRALEPIFARSSAPYQAPWENLKPHHGSFEVEEPVVHFQIPNIKGQSQREQTLAESLAIAHHIERLANEKNLGYGSFLILVKRHAYVPVYVDTLVKAGIPTSVSGGKAVEMTHVLDWLGNLFRACLDASDQVALVAVLRGPFFGVSDQDLLDVKQLDGSLSCLTEDLQEPLSHHLPESIRVAIPLIDRCRAYFRTKPPYSAFESVIKDLGLEIHFKNRENAEITYGMLLRVSDLFRSWEAKQLTFSECVEEFEWIRSGELALDTFSEHAPFGDCVRIMTVHQAKGLQADVVFLADPGGLAPRDSMLHVYREGSNVYAKAPLVKPNSFGHSVELEPLGWEEAKESERLFEEAERFRLLYVACTRAVKQLVISTNEEEKHGPWDALVSPLATTEVPVVNMGEVSVPAVYATIRVPEGDGGYQNIAEKIKDLSVPSWKFKRPSEKEDGFFEEQTMAYSYEGMGASGLGMEYGSAMHSLFERIVGSRKATPSDRQVLSWSHQLLVDRLGPLEGEKLAETAGQSALDFIHSEWWTAITGASRVLTEVPFTVTEVENGYSYVVSGVVDLAFRTSNGWIIIDYKTDAVSDQVLVERHRDQVAAYVRAWQQIFPGETCEGAIWSTFLGKTISIGSERIPK